MLGSNDLTAPWRTFMVGIAVAPRHVRDNWWAPLRAVVLALLALVVLAPVSQVASAATNTYYVNCTSGVDSRSGDSSSQAWKSLQRANQANLHPGDKLLLKRGCHWTGPLNARWSGTVNAPVVIAPYGRGQRPVIENSHDNIVVTGSYLTFDHLMTRADAPGYDSGCGNVPMGWAVGWRFKNGSSNNIVQESNLQDLYNGVLIEPGSHDNRILNNEFIDINYKDSNPASDAGAMAIALEGDNNEIAYNTITGSDTCSRFYGRDGSAVEIYGGQGNVIHHNLARENNNFVELGNARTANNTIAYNVVTSSLKIANFLVARGAGDKWGPTRGTRADNNSVYLTGANSFAIICGGGCDASILTFKSNIVWSRDRVGYVDSAWAEANNVWWSPGGPKIWFNISSHSIVHDPGFVNASAGDLRLTSGSPAIDAGTSDALNLGFTKDADGVSLPQGNAVDVGAYERPK